MLLVDRADHTAPIRRHELDIQIMQIIQIIQIIQIRNQSALKDLDQVEIDGLSDVWIIGLQHSYDTCLVRTYYHEARPRERSDRGRFVPLDKNAFS